MIFEYRTVGRKRQRYFLIRCWQSVVVFPELPPGGDLVYHLLCLRCHRIVGATCGYSPCRLAPSQSSRYPPSKTPFKNNYTGYIIPGDNNFFYYKKFKILQFHAFVFKQVAIDLQTNTPKRQI